MSKDLYSKEIKFRLFESSDIFMPHERVLKGEIFDEQYEIVINERTLPDGVPPSPPVITKIIGWDAKFYMEWEMQGNLAFDVVVSDSGTEVIRVDSYEQKSKIFDEQGLTNGTTYDLQVFTEIYNYALESTVDTVTLASRTPQNLSVTAVSKDSVEIDWDDLTESFESYRIYLKNIDTGKIEQIIGGIQNSDATVFGLEDQANYEIWVTAVSEGNLFESGESNHVTFVASSAPKNFTANVIDPSPDAPTNFTTVELPESPVNFTAGVKLPDAPANFTTTKQ